jgi:hypothetical protein
MAGAAQSMRSIWQLGKDQNLPKSYLVEFHPTHNDETVCTWSSEKLFSTLVDASDSLGITVRVTDDDSLFYVLHNDNSHSSEFIIDALNPRFLAFHTLSKATETDRFILERLIHQSTDFDSFWLPVTLLEAIEHREQVTGWEATFEPLLNERETGELDDTESVDTGDEEFPEEMVELDQDVPVTIPAHTSLRINILKRNAMRTYDRLRETDVLPDIPLSSILAERSDPDLSTVARARIKWNGKITGRGTDFSSYLQIVNGTIDNYAGTVNSLESRYWLALDPIISEYSTGFKFKGEPFCIKFSSEINVESVLGGMFNCRPPFRLMGEPERVAEGYYVVDAIDLHVGQPLAVELTCEFMRLYLYQGTCGNTIVRILRSLQHFIDANLIHPRLE